MAITNFIPTIWSARMQESLDKAHVFTSICNRDYEGEIKGFGSQIKINAIGDITVAPYVKNSTVITPQELTDAQTILAIDQARYFSFKVDDVDAAQSNPKVMDEAMRRAAYAINDVADSYIAGLHTGAGLTQTAATFSQSTALAMIAEAGQKLDEANVSRDGRFMVIPPAVHAKLVLAGLLAATDNTNTFANGFLGRLLGFDLYMSNNVAKSAAVFKIMAGIPQAIAYAEQIVSVEAFRPESSFSDAVKGLHVYGAKIIQPNALLTISTTLA